MGINQAIYTSSAKGISKGGGMGIHTYNMECSEIELADFQMSYCQYHFTGSMDEIPGLPTKYVYGKTQNGRYIAAEVTYIGKDYNKESGRMGNLVSHMYSFGKDDLNVYPMQLYGSPDFLTALDPADVDGTNEVNYLPNVSSVDPGDVINIDTIQDFLGDDRIEMFCHLLAAVIEKDTIHKVIIHDTHDNILKWIASIEYALPPQCARKVSFSSYEYDPMMSEFDIRGAIAGVSKGSCEDYAESGQFYVFDGVNRTYPNFDVSSDFFQFGISMGLAYSYEALLEFYKFLNAYSYEKVDTDIYKGFKLFQMVQGGMASLQNKEFMEAVSFEGKYGDTKSYLEMLDQLTERLETTPAFDEKFLENLQKLVTDFYERELSEKELSHILDLTLKTDAYADSRGVDLSENDGMWNDINVLIYKAQSENLIFAMNYLASQKAYRRLAGIQAYIVKVAKKENLERNVTKFFTGFWMDASEEECKFYDPVIKVVADVFRSLEDGNERYLNALNMFLTVQEMGKGAIAGNGCNSLVQMIEKETDLLNKKQFQLNRKKKDNSQFDAKQTKCAFEAFNYTQRNGVAIPITKIRLQHLAKCIVKTYEEEVSMTKAKALSVYSSYPIVVEHLSDEDLRTYFELLADVISTAETSREEYQLLFDFWKLTGEQKEIMIDVFAKIEFDYFKKEKLFYGLEQFLGAAIDVGDAEYTSALKTYVSDLKGAFKEKITETVKSKSDKEIRDYWAEISKEEKKTGKKGFFRFGKRN